MFHFVRKEEGHKTVTITETTPCANKGGPKRNRSEVRPSIATRQPVGTFSFCHNRPGAIRTSLQTCSNENVNNMRQERSESARERRIVSNLLFYAISHYGLYQGESGDYSDVSRFGLAVRLVSGRTSVRYRFGSPFSSKRLWFVDTVL